MDYWAIGTVTKAQTHIIREEEGPSTATPPLPSIHSESNQKTERVIVASMKDSLEQPAGIHPECVFPVPSHRPASCAELQGQYRAMCVCVFLCVGDIYSPSLGSPVPTNVNTIHKNHPGIMSFHQETTEPNTVFCIGKHLQL